jgi:hypothetical protein
MSPKDYKQLSNKFIDRLRLVCKDENLSMQVLQPANNASVTDIIRIENELYSLYNNGQRAYWEFIGYTNG